MICIMSLQSSVVHCRRGPIDELRNGRQSVSAPSHMRSSRAQVHTQIWFHRRISSAVPHVSASNMRLYSNANET